MLRVNTNKFPIVLLNIIKVLLFNIDNTNTSTEVIFYFTSENDVEIFLQIVLKKIWHIFDIANGNRVQVIC